MSAPASGNSAVASAAAGVKNAASNAVEAITDPSSWTGSAIASTTGMIVCGILAVGLYIGSFVVISQFVGTKDSQNQIKPEINKILGLTIGGSFALFLALLLYFIKDPSNIIYIVLIMSCITLALSYSALAISAISK
jgi:hypothetical protein|uniref:Uncharacterized protein n=1 Tax=viral metagenome TaxID=1070528 RepID=A0A6C0DE52_9ZZZZ